jgi:hypothetical protein
MTKYASRYHTNGSHDLYDSREIGETMANFLLPLFDPTKDNVTPIYDTKKLIVFTDAKKLEAFLPGDLCYLNVHHPNSIKHLKTESEETQVLLECLNIES